jgi:hypothetical protein
MSRAESPLRRDPIPRSSPETPIAFSPVPPLGTELESIASDVLQGLQYSFVAAVAQPDVRLPFDSLEEAFQDAIALRPAQQRWAYHSRARRIAMAPPALRESAFGRLARLGAEEFARGGLAIAWRHVSAEQSPARRIRIARRSSMPGLRAEASPTSCPSNTTLTFFITEVGCEDRSEEAAKGDELAIAGLALDADGSVAKVERFPVRGDFEHGLRKQFGTPGHKFCEFRVSGTPRDQPLTYVAVPFLEVADRAGFSESMAGALAKATPIVREAVETRKAGAEAGAVSRATAWVVERFVRWLGEEFQDQVILPGVAFAGLHAGMGRDHGWNRSEVAGELERLTFASRQASYCVSGQWRLSRGV